MWIITVIILTIIIWLIGWYVICVSLIETYRYIKLNIQKNKKVKKNEKKN